MCHVCRDVLFLDMALEAASRGVVESSLGLVKASVAAASAAALTAAEGGLSSVAAGLMDALAMTALCQESASRTLATNEELSVSLLDFEVINDCCILCTVSHPGIDAFAHQGNPCVRLDIVQSRYCDSYKSSASCCRGMSAGPTRPTSDLRCPRHRHRHRSHAGCTWTYHACGITEYCGSRIVRPQGLGLEMLRLKQCATPESRFRAIETCDAGCNSGNGCAYTGAACVGSCGQDTAGAGRYGPALDRHDAAHCGTAGTAPADPWRGRRDVL